ncbi:MAG: hypothetical protein LBP52_07205 [Burkholderiaceae bacterium]|nr:hypothetical protein [Burkholderiaceae bacterium]
MHYPSPAIVAQDAARRLPRWALIAICLAYVAPGYIGRDPWRNADISGYAHMLALRDAPFGAWLEPTLMGQAAESGALMPYWIGALALHLAPDWLAPAFAVRVPFALLLVATLVATWLTTFFLAQHRGAQPVAFAFGGEARPLDYARALADASLLALIATLGLAQLSHETTPALAQLAFASWIYFGVAALQPRPRAAWVALALAFPALALSGAPVTALVWALLTLLGVCLSPDEELPAPRRARVLSGMAAITVGLLVLVAGLDLVRWQLAPPQRWSDWQALIRLLLWFTWPSWPLVLWALWRWRHQLMQVRWYRHLGLPVMMASVPLVNTVLTNAPDRALLLALPALATLAAFALPTLRRSVSALIDWFSVLFFTVWAIVIWVVWLSLQTGIPAKPAANVARLAPGFEPVFQWPALIAALLASLAWLHLACWRTGRHRTALWKSLVLPASGAALCWLLLMTLWLPALNYGRSLAPQMQRVRAVVGEAGCVETLKLSTAQLAGAWIHGGWAIEPVGGPVRCDWLLADAQAQARVDERTWRYVQRVRRPTEKTDVLLLYRRTAASSAPALAADR